MKRTILTAALALSLVSTLAIAHPIHSTGEGDQTQQMGPGMMMGQGAGMGWGGGQGHGVKGMRGQGMRGHGMGMMGMHGGQGMGMMGMHGRGMGMMGNTDQCLMGQGMYGAGMMGSGLVEQRDAFLDSTKELRKAIHDKKFEYMEATRNPEETVGSLRKKADELSTLKQDLMDKRQKAFTQK